MPEVLEKDIVRNTHAPVMTQVTDKAAEVVKQATAFAERATETLGRQVPGVRRAVRRGRWAYEDAKFEALHEVRSHPVRTVGLALLAGVVIGLTIGAVGGRRVRS